MEVNSRRDREHVERAGAAALLGPALDDAVAPRLESPQHGRVLGMELEPDAEIHAEAAVVSLVFEVVAGNRGVVGEQQLARSRGAERVPARAQGAEGTCGPLRALHERLQRQMDGAETG